MTETVITFNNMEIPWSSQFKFFGINIINNSECSSNIQSLCLELNKSCYTIKSSKDIVSFYILKNLYFSTFQSLLSYGLSFWSEESESMKYSKYKKGYSV
jgi:hypothetical protein